MTSNANAYTMASLIGLQYSPSTMDWTNNETSIDVVASGTLTRKSIEAAKALLEDMISNYYNQSSKTAPIKNSIGIYGVDSMDLLASKVDVLVQ